MNPNQYNLAAYEEQFNQISDEILRHRFPQTSSDKDLSPPLQRIQIPKEFENSEEGLLRVRVHFTNILRTQLFRSNN